MCSRVQLHLLQMVIALLQHRSQGCYSRKFRCDWKGRTASTPALYHPQGISSTQTWPPQPGSKFPALGHFYHSISPSPARQPMEEGTTPLHFLPGVCP